MVPIQHDRFDHGPLEQEMDEMVALTRAGG
jgi:hypothetical protein